MTRRSTGWISLGCLFCCMCLLYEVWAEEPQSPMEGAPFPAEQAFTAALTKNGVQEKFAAHCQFVKKLFSDSEGEKTFRDKTGNCRLRAVEFLVARPESALNWAEFASSKAMAAARSESAPMLLLKLMSAVTDSDEAPTKESEVKAQLSLRRFQEVAEQMSRIEQASTAQTLELVESVLLWAKDDLFDSQMGLTVEEYFELTNLLYAQTTGELTLGHRFADTQKGRRTTDLLEKIDRAAQGRVAGALALLRDKRILAACARIEATAEAPQVPGVKGRLLQASAHERGKILVGGKEDNEYQLDELADVAVVIDLGGNDTYLEGTTTDKRPVLVVIDLAGNDTYRGEKPGIQGGAILGASLLMDLAGDDQYMAVDVAQGSALGGIGVLLDVAGNDKYTGDRRVQGQATGGLGLLLDRAGDDKYRAALLAQGVGGPLGCGALIDLDGADHYFAGGKYPGGYDDTPGFGGWSQGVGVGPRGVANGGIGALLDGGGDDLYEADYFSHGGGYWFAAGVARDFGGNDQRIGATRENFDGTARTEPRFVRWGTGYGCHYAAGFVIDDTGNDIYQADFAVIGYAWDIAVAGICDLAGDDKYLTTGSGVCEAHNAAVSILYDKSGNDEYQGGLARTEEKTEYHPDGGSGNYTFLLDGAGEDKYPADIKNGAEQTRGWAGAVLIDK